MSSTTIISDIFMQLFARALSRMRRKDSMFPSRSARRAQERSPSRTLPNSWDPRKLLRDHCVTTLPKPSFGKTA